MDDEVCFGTVTYQFPFVIRVSRATGNWTTLHFLSLAACKNQRNSDFDDVVTITTFLCCNHIEVLIKCLSQCQKFAIYFSFIKQETVVTITNYVMFQMVYIKL